MSQTTKISIGIDPGKSGGVSVIWSNGEISCEPWDDGAFIKLMTMANAQNLLDETKLVCCCEKVGAMPGQGVTSMFNFGKSVGFIEGVLNTFKIPYQLIPPQRWKKEFSLNSDKQKSIDVCKKLFPIVDLKRTERCKTDHDGKAESLLMAEFARRNL